MAIKLMETAAFLKSGSNHDHLATLPLLAVMALRQHAAAWVLVFPLGGLMNEGRFFFSKK
jgi:hypothetical protein